MSYKVLIVNEETNEVVMNKNDIVGICGAFGTNEGVTEISSFTHCHGLVMCAIVMKAQKAIDRIEKAYPEINLLKQLEGVLGVDLLTKENNTEDKE